MLWALGHVVLDCSATFTAVWASIPLKKISGSHCFLFGWLEFLIVGFRHSGRKGLARLYQRFELAGHMQLKPLVSKDC
jgi:hypothetical protein